MDTLLDDFAIEANELLNECEDTLVDIEKGSDLEQGYIQIFRCFHSLKGSSGMMGVMELQKHMHLLEDRLESYKTNKTMIIENLDYFLLGVDVAREIIKGNQVDFDYRLKAVEEKPQLDDKFDEINVELFQRLESPIVVVGSGRQGAQKIIDALKGKTVLCAASINKLNEIRESGKPLSLIVKSELLPQLEESFGKDISLHAVICWGVTDRNDYFSWDDNMAGSSLAHFLKSVTENKMLHFGFRKSVLLLLYQLSDLEEHLVAKGKGVILRTIKQEMKELMELKNKLRGDK